MHQCFNAHFPNCDAFFDMDRKFLEWEERLPAEYQLHSDPRALQEYTAAELKLLACQRYIIQTWYMIGRFRIHITSTTGLGREPQSPADIRRSMEKVVAISLQIIRFQTAVYESALRPSDDYAHHFPGNCWFFQGCFSLFEASVALITTLTQLRWREKIDEANAAIDAALRTFTEVGRREAGKTRDTSIRATEVIVTIRNQQWMEGDSGPFQLPKIKDDPEIIDFSLLVNMNKTIGDTSSMANVLASGPQFMMHGLPREQHDSASLPKFAQMEDLVSGYNRENVRMGGHMDATHVGIGGLTRLGHL